ncbi:PBP1A family penicillin-binding protein [Jeotgalibaca sp. A127]|uniref:PBP1A family penicillin-binding protein n=1 Tax=Jeotgalibaca sp. A127 TaxID=3457324 RepID=UPI003FD1BF65
MKEEWKIKIKNWYHRQMVNLKNFWRRYRINKLMVLLSLVAVLIGSTYLVFLAKTADVENLKAGLGQTTVVYDRYGEEAGELYAQKGTFVSIEEISAHIQDAVISTEDKRFYSHNGFDPIGIGRAAVGYVMNRGNIVGGGSTLTQQLAKNAYLTLDQTLIRKAKELFLALEIEKQYEKADILEMYLNNSYFGSGVWGVEDASWKYFGKPASDVTLAEGAVLAGILKAPSNYNPIDYYDNSIERRDLILQLMVDNGFTDQETANAAIAEGIYLTDGYDNNDAYNYPYYFDALIEEAIAEYNIDEEDLLNKGYKIYTGLDQQYQQQMDLTYETAYFTDAEDGTLLQSASVAIEPGTGDVMAIVGGRGEHMFRGFNRATQMRVPPASTIKPLSVYLPALENGYEVDSLIMDDDTIGYGENKDYFVANYNFYSEYQGIPMYQALVESKNTSAAYLLNEMGIEKGLKQLKEFGFTIREEDEKELGDIALGAMDGVSPLQMASAYSVFANGGVKAEPRFITKIVDATGAVIVDNTKPKTKRITSTETADEMTSMMMGTYAPGGTGYGAQPYNGMLLAGKTGTSEGDGGEYDRTKWMIGYTPDIAIATWIGFDHTDAEHNLSSTGNMFYDLFSAETGNLLSVSPQTEFAVAGIEEQAETSGGFLDDLNDFGQKIEEESQKFLDWATGWFR